MDRSSSESSSSSESDNSSDIPSEIEFEISTHSFNWTSSDSDLLEDSESDTSSSSGSASDSEEFINMEISLPSSTPVEVNRTSNDDVVIINSNDLSVIDLCESPTSTPVPRRIRRRPRFPMPIQNNDSTVEIVGDSSFIPLPITLDDSPQSTNAANVTGDELRNQNAIGPDLNTEQNNRGRSRKKRSSPYSSPTNRLSGNSSSSNNDSSKFICPICFESLIGNNPMSTLCGHIFCKTCLMKVLKATKCCPVCKKMLNMNHVHKIYI